MKNTILIAFPMLALPWITTGQTPADTTKLVDLEAIEIRSYRAPQAVRQLPDVHQTYIIGGRKNEVLDIKDLPANLAEKTGRQLFAKVPGAFIYDMDGAGNQVNLAIRGLDPHRSWEFNVRQNGIVINTDIYGYPASHYSMPMESIERVELVRGTAALQYGQQFGGMINYVTKSADTTRAFSLETINTAGSFGLFSSYNAVGGKVGKLTYYAYYQKRVSEGYRDGARSDAEAQFASLSYDFTPRLSLRAELGRSVYLYRLPGPLTDAMFAENPRQATRQRDYYSPDIYVPSLTLDWAPSERTSLQWVVSGVYGTRSSVMFEGFADRIDRIDSLTNAFAPRNVHIDRYHTRTSELRLLHHYQLGGMKSVLSTGARYYNNRMERQQRGEGTTGFDYDLGVRDGFFGRDVSLHSHSIAFYLENMIYLNSRLSLSPGLRYEYGRSQMSGFIDYLEPAEVPNEIRYNFPALGVNAQYRFHALHRLYGGISQANRPVMFKDVIPASTLAIVNEGLRDAFGFNAEIGLAGYWGERIKYDLTYFWMQYNNRVGDLVLERDGGSVLARSNIGNSRSQGVELFAEAALWQGRQGMISAFSSTAYLDAVYQNAALALRGENIDISGNRVEATPRWTSRNGLTLVYRGFSALLQYSYVAESFSDPLNTAIPTANGAAGPVPAYGLWDFNLAYKFFDRYIFRLGVNNLTDEQYFTRRPLFYPGPGIWSSDGRSIVVSLGAKF
jgi:Fe(3+) dicitrate transport protein